MTRQTNYFMFLFISINKTHQIIYKPILYSNIKPKPVIRSQKVSFLLLLVAFCFLQGTSCLFLAQNSPLLFTNKDKQPLLS